MKVVMIGTGYVGLVTGTCFSEYGNSVVCLDVDARKVDRLNHGEVPIYEPGLEELISRNVKAGRLKFTTNYAETIPGARCVFICVGTPTKPARDESDPDWGAADLKYVEASARAMAPHLDRDAVVVVKSTVPVGTNRLVAGILKDATGSDVDVASNPEFLKEGAAIDDFTKPDRVVVGTRRPEVTQVLRELYRPFLWEKKPFLSMTPESAEMTKYVANCMLATKISFINEVANICEATGADVTEVHKGITTDRRIGDQFLFPGVGYGGSCFPKDVREFIALAGRTGLKIDLLRAVDSVNDRQKEVLFRKIHRFFQGDLRGKTFAVWGLAFKPRTDDIREAPARVLIKSLLAAGAGCRVHDPEAMSNIRAEFGEKLSYFDNQYEALDGADALAICTEWQPFRTPDFAEMSRRLKRPVIFDGRNLYPAPKMAELGFYYDGIGLMRPTRVHTADGG